MTSTRRAVRAFVAVRAVRVFVAVRAVRAFVAVLAVLAGCACDTRETAPLRLVTTTSVKDSGLLDALLPAFKERSGIEVGVIAQGTGIALKIAARGEADAVITHDKEREDIFVAAGHAKGRRVFATSDFVIVGPPENPAAIQELDAAAAFRRLSESRASFASRGDSSGTHARELILWKAAAMAHPQEPAYVEVRAGMATTLQFASDKDAYTLTDRATYLAHKDGLRLRVLVEGDPRLANNYAVMVINPEKHGEADAERAQRLADWLFSDEAREIIRAQSRAGEPLFRLPGEVGLRTPEGRPNRETARG